jgi:hypothetical protein
MVLVFFHDESLLFVVFLRVPRQTYSDHYQRAKYQRKGILILGLKMNGWVARRYVTIRAIQFPGPVFDNHDIRAMVESLHTHE